MVKPIINKSKFRLNLVNSMLIMNWISQIIIIILTKIINNYHQINQINNSNPKLIKISKYPQ